MSQISRRCLLRGTAVAATSLLVPITVRAAEWAPEPDVEITDWVVISSNGEITLGLSQPEVGQGAHFVRDEAEGAAD